MKKLCFLLLVFVLLAALLVSCVGNGDGCSVRGLKGYFAFPISDMCNASGQYLTADSLVTGVYIYMSHATADDINKPIYFDNVQLVVDYTTVK